MWTFGSACTLSAWLLVVCGIFQGATAPVEDNCYTEKCLGEQYDRREGVCCGNRYHPGAGLSCCGPEPFNPGTATCCRVGHRDKQNVNVTKGLSESVSSCCGLRAYNSLSEMCCQSKVVTMPTAFSQCCAGEAYDKDTQLCCGPPGDKKLHKRNSSHHFCCGQEQFNSTSHHCCQKDTGVEILAVGFKCDVDNSGAIDEVNRLDCGPPGDKKTHRRKSSNHFCCGQEQFNNMTHHCCQKDTGVEILAVGFKCDVDNSGAIDEVNRLDCGPPGDKKTHRRKSSHHFCCGQEQFNSTSHHCCQKDTGVEILAVGFKCDVDNSGAIDEVNRLDCGPPGDKKTHRRKSSHHFCCGQEQFNSTSHHCCQKDTGVEILAVGFKCDVDNSGAIDEVNRLDCGPPGDKKTHRRKSSHHFCCGQEQFNSTSHHCCQKDTGVEILAVGFKCDVDNSGVQQQEPEHKPNCIKPESRCGAQCYNPDTQDCCRRDQSKASGCCASGQRDVKPTVYNPHTHICCDGCLSEKTLQTNQLNDPQGHQCCGTDVYLPQEEICCDGQRHPKRTNVNCCGHRAYNVTDPRKKCCAKALYDLSASDSHATRVRCCGSVLQNQQSQVCCSGEDKKVIYSAKTRFRCCGHLYYNTSLRRCCAGSPVLPTGKHRSHITDWKHVSGNSLNETPPCNEMYTGI